jgi:hypothetical protein
VSEKDPLPLCFDTPLSLALKPLKPTLLLIVCIGAVRVSNFDHPPQPAMAGILSHAIYHIGDIHCYLN